MYAIKVDADNNILVIANITEIQEKYVEISDSEYCKANKYRKFNPTTREFSETINTDTEELTIDKRVSQLEEATGLLSEQIAKQSFEA